MSKKKSGTIPVPIHPGKTMKPGTLGQILKAAGLTPNELGNLL